MSKNRLIERIFKDIKFRGFPKIAIEEMVKCSFDSIVAEAKNGNSSTLANFGSFQIKKRLTKKGRNPNTGEDLIIQAHSTLKFTPSQKLNELIK